MELKLDVNGRIVVVDADPASPLLDVLRDELRLFGTKDGCREGECGACTVLVDGLPVDSCLYPVAAAVDTTIETVESLWSSELGRRLQCGLVDEGGIQCGFCTPGVVMTLTALLRDDPRPSEGDIRTALAGNICRCTGYGQIVDAALAAGTGEA